LTDGREHLCKKCSKAQKGESLKLPMQRSPA
jgi:hypothetical protein